MRSVILSIPPHIPAYAVLTPQEGIRGYFFDLPEAILFAEVLSRAYPLAKYEVVKNLGLLSEEERVFFKAGERLK